LNQFVVVTVLLGSFTLTACSGGLLGSTNELDPPQVTARYETAVAVGTQAGTVVALQSTADSAPLFATQLSQLENENQELQETVEAVLTLGVPVIPRYTPTPSLVSAPPRIISGEYQEILTTANLDESTGCALDKRGRFSVDINRVYLATIGQGIQANTTHQVRWYFDEELRYESALWIADQDYEEVCIFFWLEPSYTPFVAGLWAADLYVDNEFMVRVPFELCETGALC